MGALEGMVYLSQHNIVHRDLAARNCLYVVCFHISCSGHWHWISLDTVAINCMFFRLDGSLQVKIGDFGISRAMEEKEYYTVSEGGVELPVRWMSPESLLSRVFSTKSDVVSKPKSWSVSLEKALVFVFQFIVLIVCQVFIWSSSVGDLYWGRASLPRKVKSWSCGNHKNRKASSTSSSKSTWQHVKILKNQQKFN